MSKGKPTGAVQASVVVPFGVVRDIQTKPWNWLSAPRTEQCAEET
jgi:hypothetical protein